MIPEVKIKIFTIPNCSFCFRAVSLLNNLKENYLEIKVDKSKFNQQVELNLEYNHTFPIIFINGSLIGGYSDLLTLVKEDSL